MKHAQGHFSLLIFQRCLVCSSQEEEGVRSSCYSTFLANLLLTIKEHALSPSPPVFPKAFCCHPRFVSRGPCVPQHSTAESHGILEKGVSTPHRYVRWSSHLTKCVAGWRGWNKKSFVPSTSGTHASSIYLLHGLQGGQGRPHAHGQQERLGTPRWWCCWWGEGLASLRAALQLWGLCIRAGSLVRAVAIFKAFSSLGNFCIIM